MIGSARMPSQTSMTRVWSSLMVARCWAIVSWKPACAVSDRVTLMDALLRRIATLGQGHAEGAALSGFALDHDVSAVGLNQLLDQSETKPKALCLDGARLAGPVELLEDALLHVRGHADPGVRDRHPGPVVPQATADGDASAGGRVADGVGQEVPEDAEQGISV